MGFNERCSIPGAGDVPHLSTHGPLQARQRKHGSSPSIGVLGRVPVERFLLLRLLAQDFQKVLSFKASEREQNKKKKEKRKIGLSSSLVLSRGSTGSAARMTSFHRVLKQILSKVWCQPLFQNADQSVWITTIKVLTVYSTIGYERRETQRAASIFKSKRSCSKSIPASKQKRWLHQLRAAKESKHAKMMAWVRCKVDVEHQPISTARKDKRSTPQPTRGAKAT